MSKIKCTCVGSTNYQITMTNGDTYSYDPSARLYSHYNVSEGKWLLGGYRSGGVCSMQAGETCETETHPIRKGTITFIGISGFNF